MRFAPLSWFARYVLSLRSIAAGPPATRSRHGAMQAYRARRRPVPPVAEPPQREEWAPQRQGELPSVLRTRAVRGPGEGASLSSFVRTLALAGLLFTLLPSPARADGLRAGILKFGTVEWLLDVIRQHKLDVQEGYDLNLLALASNNALQVALLGGEADVIVTDWFWVLRQRAAGDAYQFAPYSTSVGAVMVPANSPIKSVTDLRDKKIGVAGGPLDKSWLLLRARGMATSAGDLADTARPVFGAPPLLNQQALYGDVDALLTYWHFAAQLEAAGFKRLVSASELMKEVGLKSDIPLIGFTFSGKLAKEKPDMIAGFVRSVRAAQEILLKSDAEWERLRPLMRPQNDAEFQALKSRYREGITFAWGREEQAEAGKLFDILARIGGEELTGKNVTFDPQMFWQPPPSN